MLAHLLLTFQHRAGVRPYTSSFDFAESCVFDKQSLPPILCHPTQVALNGAPLLPKLRGQFAEFLQHHSLKRLRLFDASTSVGFGYGLYVGAISWTLSKASWNPFTRDFLTAPSLSHRSRNINRVPISYDFRPHLRGRLTLR
jgi:hypothetical protein